MQVVFISLGAMLEVDVKPQEQEQSPAAQLSQRQSQASEEQKGEGCSWESLFSINCAESKQRRSDWGESPHQRLATAAF